MTITDIAGGSGWLEPLLSDRGHGPRLARLRTSDDQIIVLPVQRWHEEPTAADATVLARAEGPVLDVGCGPGRHVAALAKKGVIALGVDVSAVAVSAARRRGAAALQASIFDPLPDAGCWATALLLDGNIGIGGDEQALLARVADVLKPGGHVLIEVDPPSVRAGRFSARLEIPGRIGPWFPWARVTPQRLETLAAAAGYTIDETWEAADRWFVDLCSQSTQPALHRKAG